MLSGHGFLSLARQCGVKGQSQPVATWKSRSGSWNYSFCAVELIPLPRTSSNMGWLLARQEQQWMWYQQSCQKRYFAERWSAVVHWFSGFNHLSTFFGGTLEVMRTPLDTELSRTSSNAYGTKYRKSLKEWHGMYRATLQQNWSSPWEMAEGSQEYSLKTKCHVM